MSGRKLYDLKPKVKKISYENIKKKYRWDD